tara:strand:+ start:61 stop:1458 length:1398 start_codon:yes stop_codon:yes gene_type:complete
MATKRKSIIEEALLEAKSLEDALKANTKEMLSAHMKKEIENIVESSLREDEEEVEELEIDVEGSDEEEDVPAIDAGDNSEGDAEEALANELELDLDLDALAADDDVELDVVELPIDLDMGDEEELDLTGASDEEVIAVFKKMSDDDEVEVVKDEDGIHLTDNETGAEYYIKESEEVYEDDELCEGCGSNDEVVYEIELDEKFDDLVLGGNKDDISKTHDGEDFDESYDRLTWGDDGMDDSHTHPGDKDFTGKKGLKSKTHPGKLDYMEETEEIVDLDEEDEITEDKTQNNKQSGPYGGGRQRYSGAKAGTSYANESKKSRKPLSNRKPKNVERVSESKIMKEYKELKSKNEEYKGALKVFKNKLNEVALFNTNLAYVNRLFTEHSTTKTEKMQILRKFDDAESIKESKSIYKTVKGELDNKKPITESVESRVNKTVKSSKSELNESTTYVDPQIAAIKDLMRKIS